MMSGVITLKLCILWKALRFDLGKVLTSTYLEFQPRKKNVKAPCVQGTFKDDLSFQETWDLSILFEDCLWLEYQQPPSHYIKSFSIRSPNHTNSHLLDNVNYTFVNIHLLT